jgi:hypothetical protein
MNARARVAVLALAIALLAVVAVGCQKAEPVPHDPSITGIVVARTFLANSQVQFDLDSGQSVTVNQNTVPALTGGTPDVGYLFFYGEQPQPWFVAFLRDPNGRFEVRSLMDRTPDGRITFDFGLRLPRAKAYHSTGRGPMEADAPVLYVVSETGEVIEGP